MGVEELHCSHTVPKFLSAVFYTFHIIEERIQKELSPGQKYPVVFVFTDGWGSTVKPHEPKKWHWFIDGGRYCTSHAMTLSSKECNFHKMKDFN